MAELQDIKRCLDTCAQKQRKLASEEAALRQWPAPVRSPHPLRHPVPGDSTEPAT